MFLTHIIVTYGIANLLCISCVRCQTNTNTINIVEKPKERTVKDSDLCPAVNPRYPVLLPHPQECGKFYICDNGMRYLKECHSGLHFNPSAKTCDYPENAKCDTTFKELPKGKNIGDGSNLCPAKNSKYPILLPHPDDCSKFYVCDGGSAHLKECQFGLHFNRKINACDYPGNAKCDKAFKELPKGKNGGDGSNLCPTKNSNYPVLLPHPDDCSKFYICDGGSAHMKECQFGLHFNRKINACDYPGNAGCDKALKELPKGKNGGDGSNLCPAKNSEYPILLPHPDDCSKFYVCDGGSAHLKECQSGLHFNRKINACDYPGNAGCDKAFKELPKGKNTGDGSNLCPAKNSKHPILLPHPDDCSKFYICDGGSAHLKECQIGLHFNRKINACDYPGNAGCDKGARMEMAGVPSPYCPSTNGETPIFFRHSTNCSVYYMCGNGFAYEFVCPSRLQFNVRKQVCDYEWNSGCQNSSQ